MDSIVSKPPDAQPIFRIAFFVLLACLGLFSLDRETHHFSDLLKPGNLAALILYFTPALVISLLLYSRFSKTYNKRKSLILSLVTGIPISFAFVIYLLMP